MGQEDYQELSSFLRRFIRRLRFLRCGEGICLILTCALILFALGPGVAYLKVWFPYAPLAYAVLSSAVLLFLLVRTLARSLARLPQERAAVYIEQRQPQLRNNLINSLQLYPQLAGARDIPEFSASMVLALLRSTRKQVAGLRVEDLVDSARLRAHARVLGLVFLPVLAMVLFNPRWVGETFSLLSRPLDYVPPSETAIDLDPKGVRIVRGSPLTIQAQTAGALPQSLELIVWAGTNERGERVAEEKLPMENLGGGKFTARLPRLDKTLHYRAATGAFSSPVYTAEAVDPPEVGNLQATVYPPAYTGLRSVTVAGGNVESLRGSSVRIEAAVTKDVARAEIVLDDGKRVPLKRDGRKLQGHLVVFQSQRYQIVAEDEGGFRNSPVTYQLTVKPDGFPTIDLLAPGEDLEVTGDEILPIEYSARDDFGISEVHLVFKIADREEKIRLYRDEAKRLILRDQTRWDLGKLALKEGEEAVFHLEVLDNDTISGPKLGTSRALRLRLKNLRGEHRQVAEIVRDLNHRMLELLGDHLEQPLGNQPADASNDHRQRFEQKLNEAVRRTEEALRRMEKDRLADFATWSDLEALKRNLQFTKDDLVGKQAREGDQAQQDKARDEIAAELERMSLLSEDIVNRMKAQELASTARDLTRSQEQLMDALDKLQVGDKNLDAILKQISELGKLLGSLQQALSQFAQQMTSDDFMNMDSLRGLGFSEMFSALDEIRKKLLQGDIEGARQLARELFNQMASMVAALQNSQRSAMSSATGRMQGEMSRSASELQQIAREQQEILMGTEALEKSHLSERDELLKQRLDEFLARAKEALGGLTELFPDREGGETGDTGSNSRLDDATMNHLLKNLIAKLLQKDFPGYLEGDRLARAELGKKRTPGQEGKAQQTDETLAALRTELESIMARPNETLTDTDKQELRRLAQRQEVLRDRTRELHEKLESLFQLFPSLDPKIVQNIGEAGASMGEARERLGGLDARNAIPPEQQALDRLSQSQQQMQSAMEQLAQRGQLGNMPVPMVFRRGRFLPGGMLVPLPGVPQFPEFNVEGGVTGLDMERFRLPGKEDYKAPRNFREEILESLKQGVPPQHKDQIERYFKNLTE